MYKRQEETPIEEPPAQEIPTEGAATAEELKIKEELEIRDGKAVGYFYVDLGTPRREISNQIVRRRIYSDSCDKLGDSIPLVLHYDAMPPR